MINNPCPPYETPPRVPMVDVGVPKTQDRGPYHGGAPPSLTLFSHGETWGTNVLFNQWTVIHQSTGHCLEWNFFSSLLVDK